MTLGRAGETTEYSGMPRTWVWLQLVIGWLPVWALFTMLVSTAHRDTSLLQAALLSLRMILAAAVLGIGVQRLADRMPWPHPFRTSFVAVHVAGAVAYAVAWFLLNSVIESILRARAVMSLGPGVVPYLVLGVWLYVMVAGVVYATRATERAARAEGAAVRSQLQALRGQLNPHFLFNAMHTVVQLIPQEPQQAARAAEQVAGLLRTTLEEDRDLVTLGEEWAFVERYLALEGLRFGDRLLVEVDIPEALCPVEVPSFTVQTLVENAVRHGAGPSVVPVTITIAAAAAGTDLEIIVRDTGVGAGSAMPSAAGTGLRRLRERLEALYGEAASLALRPGASGGFEARVRLPRRVPDE